MGGIALKYRSKVRDEVRVIHIGRSSEEEPGRIILGRSARPITEQLGEARTHSRQLLLEHFGTDHLLANDALNGIYEWLNLHASTILRDVYAVTHPTHRMLINCLHHALLSTYTAIELTFDGMGGFARPHIRHAFEALMIAKFCAIHPESDIFDKWMDGLEIYFTKGVLKKIKKPDISEFTSVWSSLSDWSHATTFAGQRDLSAEEIIASTGSNLQYISPMLEFSFHLLNTHILTPSIKYYAKSQLAEVGEYWEESRDRTKEALSILHSYLCKDARYLVKCYKATWVVIDS